MRKPFVILWVGIALSILFVWIYFPLFSRYRELKTQEESLERQIVEINVRIQELVEERNLLRNDIAYLENVIRRELGLVKPGESVYKFVTEVAAPEEEAGETAADAP